MKKIVAFALVVLMILGLSYVYLPNLISGYSYVVVDINPSVELLVNSLGIVVQANALNDDGEIILQDENFVGLTAEAASTRIVELALALGYLDPEATESDPNAVLITTYNESGYVDGTIKNRILDKLTNFFADNGIWGTLFTAEEIDTILAEAESYGMSPGKYKLVQSVLNYTDEYTFEQLSAMYVRSLIDILGDKQPLQAERGVIQDRIEVLEAIAAETRTVDEQAELDALYIQLDNINALIEEARLAKIDLKQSITEYKIARREFRQSVRNRIKDVLKGLSSETKEQMKQALYASWNS